MVEEVKNSALVSSTAAITLISRRVENASNPHDYVKESPKVELPTENRELTLVSGAGEHLAPVGSSMEEGSALGLGQMLSPTPIFIVDKQNILKDDRTAMVSASVTAGSSCTADDVMAIGQVIVEPESYLDCTLWDARDPVGAASGELCEFGVLYSQFGVKDVKKSITPFTEVSSTAAITIISRRVENASNPHDCVREIPNSELRIRSARSATPNSELTMQSTQKMCDRSGRTHVVQVLDIVGKNIKDVCEKGYQYLKVLGLFNGSSKLVKKYGNKSSWEMLARKCLILSDIICASDNSELRNARARSATPNSELHSLPAIVEKQRIQFSEELGPQTAAVSAASMTVPVTVAEKHSFVSGSVAFLARVCEKIMDFCGQGIGRSRSHSPPGRVDKRTRPLGEEVSSQTVTVRAASALPPVVVDRKPDYVSTVVGEDDAPRASVKYNA